VGSGSCAALSRRRRRPSFFARAAGLLLGAPPARSPAATDTPRLYARLREQNEILDRSLQIHRRFTDAALRGLGLAGIAEILAALVGQPVRITPATRLGVPPVTVPPEARPTRGQPPMRQSIEAGGRVLGTLEILRTGSLSVTDVTAAEHARTVCGLELVKLELAAEVGGRHRSRLLDDLLDGVSEPAGLRARARRIRIDLDQPFRLMVIRATTRRRGAGTDIDDIVRSALGEGLGAAAARTLLTKRAGALLVALPAAVERHVTPLTERLAARLEEAGGCGAIGVGPQAADLRSAYTAAEACAAFAVRTGTPDGLHVVSYDRLGLMSFLLDAPDVDHTAAWVARMLEPLWRHDRGSRMQMLPTLREYLAADGHHGRACERLFIGATTLKYRLRRISELIDRVLRDGSVRFELRLALQLADVLDAQRAAKGPVSAG